MKISKSTWIGGPLFDAVCTAFTERGYTAPQPDVPGGSGAYAMNIVSQYFGRLSEHEALSIINAAGDNRELPRRYQTSGVEEQDPFEVYDQQRSPINYYLENRRNWRDRTCFTSS